MKREYVGKTPEEAIEIVLNKHLTGYYSYAMATPLGPPLDPMVEELMEALLSTGGLIRPEDAVDDHTNTLIEQLVQQNRTLEKSASLYAEKIATVDFITLDRDMWRSRYERLRERELSETDEDS